ncbi:MAG: hypothetical protein ACK5P7_05020 [Bdellovibrio sp.]
MKMIRFLMTFAAILSLLIASIPQAAMGKSKFDLSPSTREFLAVLQEGPETENLAAYYNRMAKFLPAEVAQDFSPFLENKGKLKAPHTKVDGDTVTYSYEGMTLVMKIKSESAGNVISINKRVLTKKDLSTVKGLVSKIEKILTEDYGKPKSAAAGLFNLLVPQAHAQIDWMPLLLGGALGAAGGYFLGGTTGALLGGALGAAVGYFFFSGNKCGKTPECCWDGGNTADSYKSGCCSKLKATPVTPVSVCVQATASPAPIINYNSPPAGSLVPAGTR